eukprot:gene9200-16339_t
MENGVASKRARSAPDLDDPNVDEANGHSHTPFNGDGDGNMNGTNSNKTHDQWSKALARRAFRHDPWVSHFARGYFNETNKVVELFTQVEAGSGDVAFWTRVEKRVQQDLELSFAINRIDHNLFGGRFTWATPSSGSYNAKSIGELTRIKWSLLEGNMSIDQAFTEMNDVVTGARLTPWEKFFHCTLLAMTFYKGEIAEAGWAVVCALLASVVIVVDAKFFSLHGTDDFVAAFLVGVVGETARRTDKTLCSQAIVMGTLTWFFYGTPLVLGMMEVLDGWAINGVTRFWMAIIKTYSLALGAAMGTWLSNFWMGEDNINAGVSCTLATSETNIAYVTILPIVSFAAQGQLKVGHWQMLPTLITQQIAWWTQVLIDQVAKQNTVISNVGPSFAATLTAYVLVDVMRRRRPKTDLGLPLKGPGLPLRPGLPSKDRAALYSKPAGPSKDLGALKDRAAPLKTWGSAL